MSLPPGFAEQIDLLTEHLVVERGWLTIQWRLIIVTWSSTPTF